TDSSEQNRFNRNPRHQRNGKDEGFNKGILQSLGKNKSEGERNEDTDQQAVNPTRPISHPWTHLRSLINRSSLWLQLRLDINTLNLIHGNPILGSFNPGAIIESHCAVIDQILKLLKRIWTICAIFPAHINSHHLTPLHLVTTFRREPDFR